MVYGSTRWVFLFILYFSKLRGMRGKALHWLQWCALLFKTRSVVWHNGEAQAPCMCVCVCQPFCSSERKYRVAKAGVSLLAASLSLFLLRKRGGL